MNENSSLTFIAIVLLLGVNAFFTMARQALTRARRSRLRQLVDEDHKGAARALTLAEGSNRLVAALQLGTILVHFLTATLVVLGIANPLADWLISLGMSEMLAGAVRYVIVIPLAAVIVVLFGEMLPGEIAAHHAERLAILLTPWAKGLIFLLEPPARALSKLSSWMAAPFGDEKSMTDDVIEEDIMTLVDVGKAEGVIEEEEEAMIHSIFQFTDTLVREVMVPRIDMVAIEIDTPLDSALDTIIGAGHSRIPVYRESIDHIKGILYAKDLLTLWQENSSQNDFYDTHVLSELMREAYYIPEAKKAFDLLAELQQKKVHIAIVVDEYGGTAGLVTIEDLIEEIVGEIQDEYDLNEEATFEQLNENEYIFDARIDLDDLNRTLDSTLDTDIADTLGGYIFSVIGRAPEIGERFQEENLAFKVLGVTGRRIRKVQIQRLSPPLEDSRGEMDAAPD